MKKLLIMLLICTASCRAVRPPMNYAGLTQEQQEEAKYKRNRVKAATIIIVGIIGFTVINEAVKTDWIEISKRN